MILTDLLDVKNKNTRMIAKACGVEKIIVRLPESKNFNPDSFEQMRALYNDFVVDGLTPIGIEPMPPRWHEHVKRGDEKRDECIEKIIAMLGVLDKLNMRLICFNFMPYIGWLRTSTNLAERGGATVTGFSLRDFLPTDDKITAQKLWENYEYFIKAILPYAAKYGIKLALHPDDPPLDLGGVERIMVSYSNIRRALNICPSDFIGVTFCQATYKMMGEDIFTAIPKLKDKIFFVHFRNVVGNKYDFRETFHDNGSINMAEILRLYNKCGIDVPIRVDHVPTLPGESAAIAGYGDNARLFAIGYLKGLLQALEKF